MTTNPEARSSSFKRFVTDHPLTSYFVLAYAGTWIVLLPAVLAQNGLGILPFRLPDVLAFLSFVLFSSFAGPTLAAFIVTRVISGKEGVRQLLRRYVQWRVGIHWYLIALLIFLIGFLLSTSISLGVAPLTTFIQKWPLIFSSFLPNVLVFGLLGVFGEEPGWRGFALPRMQQSYGPVTGSLILGALHGFWHLPAFLVADALGPFILPNFITFVLTAIAGTVLYTWIYNNTRGSILIAILIHSASNAASGFIVQNIVPENPQLGGLAQVIYTQNWGNVIAFGILALLVIVFTRGQLSYQPAQTDKLANNV